MPKFSADYYVDGIYVKTYIIDDDDSASAYTRVVDMIEAEQLIDFEEIDV